MTLTKIPQKFRLIFTSIFLLTSVISDGWASTEKLETAGRLMAAGQSEAAYHLIHEVLKKKPRKEDEALTWFALGLSSFQLKKWEESAEAFTESIEKSPEIIAYARYYKGRALAEQKKWNEAKAELEKALTEDPTSLFKLDTVYELSKIAMARGAWRDALNHLTYMERRSRKDHRHPEILWQMILAEKKLKREWRACKWAKKLYTSYPAHQLVMDWGLDLQANKVEGQRLGCMASPSDQRRRIRTLQYSGESDRALNEIKTLEKRASGDSKYQVDVMLANYYIQEGHLDEALAILLKHYRAKQKDFDFLMLLAKAASRAGEFQTAVGAYQKAHANSPHSRMGREALFHAAFLSYQYQDYDGASRKFEQFLAKYPRSGLSRDSRWHLAWVRYLKGDFEGAAKAFEELLALKKRYRRSWRKFSEDKITYWLAMSRLRLGQTESAKKLFEKLSTDPLFDYYGIAAKYRLAALPKVELAKRDPSTEHVGDAAVVVAGSEVAGEKTAESAPEEILPDQEDEGFGDGESEEGDGEEGPIEGVDGEDEVTPDGETIIATDFKDPRLAKKFGRAKELRTVGLIEYARWELYEIERRTSNPDYRKMLMSEYEKIGAYNRSAYIGSIYFSGERKKHGIKGIRYLWEHTFPRAYENLVMTYSKSYAVPSELIWSIMRAETFYREEAVSYVGAMGLMQIMPNTGKQVARMLNISGFLPQQLKEPEMNIRLGTRYLNRLLKKFGQQVPLAAAAYNAGPHRVHAWITNFGKLEMDEFIEHIPFLQTRNYVKKVVRFYYIYGSLYDTKTPSLAWISQPVGVSLDGPVPTRETWETL